jgi:hypothetical protein
VQHSLVAWVGVSKVWAWASPLVTWVNLEAFVFEVEFLACNNFRHDRRLSKMSWVASSTIGVMLPLFWLELVGYPRQLEEVVHVILQTVEKWDSWKT